MINRENWPEILWEDRILSIGKTQTLQLTGIPEGTLESYLRMRNEPSYRNGRMIVELCEGKTRPTMAQVDWFRVISDLKCLGYSTYQIAAATAIPQSTLIGFKSGSEPRFSDGEILIEYYRAMTGKNLDQVPERPIEISAHKAMKMSARKDKK